MRLHYLPIYILSLLLTGSYLAGYIPLIIIIFYFLASLITYCVYARDKIAATKHHWRVPEKTLHLLSIFCGWPGAIIAQQTLRHKSKKVSFRLMLALTVIINSSALLAIHTPTGQTIMSNITLGAQRLIMQHTDSEQLRRSIVFIFKHSAF